MKNKKLKYGKLSDSLAKEIENIVLTTGKEIRRIAYKNCAIYSLYMCNDQSVVKKNKPLFAIYAHADVFKAFGTKKEKGGLVVCGYELDSIVTELAELIVSYEDQIKEKAA